MRTTSLTQQGQNKQEVIIMYLQACVKFQKGFSQVNIHRIPWVKVSVKMKHYTINTVIMSVEIHVTLKSF